MRASASFNFDDGIATSSWNATFAFRMRVSMSAIGSVIVTAKSLPSPRALCHARDLPGVRHLPQADPTEPEVAIHRTGATAPAAPGVRAHLEFRFALRLENQSFLRHQLPLAVTAEREAERRQERTPLVVGIGGGHDRHVHATN